MLRCALLNHGFIFQTKNVQRSDFLYLLHVNPTYNVPRCGAICHAAAHDPVIIHLMKLKWFSNQPNHYAEVITGNSSYIVTMHCILQHYSAIYSANIVQYMHPVLQ